MDGFTESGKHIGQTERGSTRYRVDNISLISVSEVYLSLSVGSLWIWKRQSITAV